MNISNVASNHTPFTRRLEAKDIPDFDLVRLVDTCQHERQIEWGTEHLPWCHRQDLEAKLPLVPPKVILAKCRALIRRGFITGCTCGCRGDFELTDKGRDFLIPAGDRDWPAHVASCTGR